MNHLLRKFQQAPLLGLLRNNLKKRVIFVVVVHIEAINKTGKPMESRLTKIIFEQVPVGVTFHITNI